MSEQKKKTPRKKAPGGAGNLESIGYITEILRGAQTTFFGIIAAAGYSVLAIAQTSDSNLLSNKHQLKLPILNVEVQTIFFYNLGPIILIIMFGYFHFYLFRFWENVTNLPIRHPVDGRSLDNYIHPWLISNALLRGYIKELSNERPFAAFIEKSVAILIGWLFIPITLLFFWGHFLVRHEPLNSAIHVVMIALALMIAQLSLLVAKDRISQICCDTEPVSTTHLAVRTSAVGAAAVVVFGFLTYSAELLKNDLVIDILFEKINQNLKQKRICQE